MSDLERELLYRLLETGEGTNTLSVGDVPPSFPLSLPADVRLLGSREQSFPQSTEAAGLPFRRSNHVRVLLDSALPVADFIAQMRDSLGNDWETSGWPSTLH
ncbi:hypothetical protein [Deinococcus alpinitundrae]|uniref:hypothetical protein n=1 Tax=Deinococcus alpinitundrae TaxID=468913 RepID=UPI00137979BD|nr:hypothetical protein [Deinococcus alpinitundrae]